MAKPEEKKPDTAPTAKAPDVAQAVEKSPAGVPVMPEELIYPLRPGMEKDCQGGFAPRCQVEAVHYFQGTRLCPKHHARAHARAEKLAAKALDPGRPIPSGAGIALAHLERVYGGRILEALILDVARAIANNNDDPADVAVHIEMLEEMQGKLGMSDNLVHLEAARLALLGA